MNGATFRTQWTLSDMSTPHNSYHNVTKGSVFFFFFSPLSCLFMQRARTHMHANARSLKEALAVNQQQGTVEPFSLLARVLQVAAERALCVTRYWYYKLPSVTHKSLSLAYNKLHICVHHTHAGTQRASLESLRTENPLHAAHALSQSLCTAYLLDWRMDLLAHTIIVN